MSGITKCWICGKQFWPEDHKEVATGKPSLPTIDRNKRVCRRCDQAIKRCPPKKLAGVLSGEESEQD